MPGSTRHDADKSILNCVEIALCVSRRQGAKAPVAPGTNRLCAHLKVGPNYYGNEIWISRIKIVNFRSHIYLAVSVPEVVRGQSPVMGVPASWAGAMSGLFIIMRAQLFHRKRASSLAGGRI